MRQSFSRFWVYLKAVLTLRTLIVCLIAGTVYAISAPPARLGIALLNISVFLISLQVGIIIHEIGHLWWGWLAGGTPRYMILGRGHEVARWNFRGIKIILSDHVSMGLAFVTLGDLPFYKSRTALYLAGGILTNVGIGLLALMWVDFESFDVFDTKVQWLAAFGGSNLLLGVVSIIPFKVQYQGISLPSDGKLLLQLPFQKRPNLTSFQLTETLLSVSDLMEDKAYEEAAKYLETYREKFPPNDTININLSVMYLKLGKYKEALQLQFKLLESPVDPEELLIHEFLIQNNIAWTYLLMNEVEKAEQHSFLAFQLNSKMPVIIGTRGASLIETGAVEEGLKLLLPQVDFRFPNLNTCSAAMYVALGMFLINRPIKQQQYLDFVLQNQDQLDKDSLFLLARINKRINS